MLAKKLIGLAVASAFCGCTTLALAAPGVVNEAVDIVGAGAVSDPLIAVEGARSAIVARLAAEYGATLDARGIPAAEFRSVLASMRADQLLAASLVNTLDEVIAIASDVAVSGPALQRFVALPPVAGAALPSAQAYLVRDAEVMKVVRAGDLRLSESSLVVGYFVPDSTTVVVSGVSRATIPLKDGTGSGTNSWIGNVTGGNVASGLDSAVTAGKFNQATGQGAFVGAGTSNAATGISSLVIGGFDNQATATDALVVAGAANRATGPRSVLVGGSHNVAGGRLSFIGGGGRDGTVNTPAGTDAKDNETTGKWTVVVGGMGNTAGALDLSAVVGGHRNTASGKNAFVGGGGCNTASGISAVIVGGGEESEALDCAFGNTASGFMSFIGAG